MPAWRRSEYSFTCFAWCQGFCCLNFCLCGSCKPGEGQNIALHAWPAARDFAIQTSAFPVHSASTIHVFCKHAVTCNVNSDSGFTVRLTWTTGSLTPRSNVNACNCTQGCTDTERVSALKVDFGRKIPRYSRELNLCWQRAGPMLYQLSYIPATA